MPKKQQQQEQDHHDEAPASSPFSFGFSSYLEVASKKRLLAYKYEGEDKSLIFKYFWVPLCKYLVEKLPRSLAPNAITLIGLIPIIVSYILFAIYMPFMYDQGKQQDTPTWVFIFSAAAIFFYQLCDNIDGMQARRTGNGTPLGLLFDHGLDNINTVFGGISIASCIQLGLTPWKSLACVITGVIVFFVNTFEEFVTGRLVLPVINGPNEGLFVVVCSYLLTAVYGTSWWLETVTVLNLNIGGSNIVVKRNDICLGFTILGGIVTVVGQLYNCYNHFSLIAQEERRKKERRSRSVGNTEDDDSDIEVEKRGKTLHQPPATNIYFAKHYPFLYALSRTAPIFVISVIGCAWFYFSETDIYSQHPRIFCWTFGLSITRLTMLLMLSHIQHQNFHPFRRAIIPLLFLMVHVIVLHFADWLAGEKLEFFVASSSQKKFLASIDERVVLAELFLLSAVSYLHAFFNVFWEVATALEISVFKVKKK